MRFASILGTARDSLLFCGDTRLITAAPLRSASASRLDDTNVRAKGHVHHDARLILVRRADGARRSHPEQGALGRSRSCPSGSATPGGGRIGIWQRDNRVLQLASLVARVAVRCRNGGGLLLLGAWRSCGRRRTALILTFRLDSSRRLRLLAFSLDSCSYKTIVRLLQKLNVIAAIVHPINQPTNQLIN